MTMPVEDVREVDVIALARPLAFRARAGRLARDAGRSRRRFEARLDSALKLLRNSGPERS